MGERQFGPYRLVHQIAVGGMAEIHLAKTKGIAGFEKYVALKMIHPNFSQDDQFIQMLIDEAKITVQLQHVNIAQTFDLGRVDNMYYITMEYVDGADLYKLLRKGSEQERSMPVDVAAYVAKEIANGLDYAHRKRDVTGRPLGIVHRDVSPQNVLISHAGEVKIVDFGIAKATMRARQTAVGVIKGKYYYMSPEQAWGDPVDHRTDIFSTGIVLYEMLTGQMLYLEEDLHKLLNMVRRAQIAPPTTLRRDIPPQLERIVMNALAKRADDRYRNAADFATDLERFLHVYSPVFTASKVSSYFHEVLGEKEVPQPAPAPAPAPEPIDPARVTKRVDRQQLARDRSEFTDENSVIFRIEDLRPDGFDEDTGAATSPNPLRNKMRTPTPPPAPMRKPRGMDDQTLVPMHQDEEEEEERTVISGPPGFGGGFDAPEETDATSGSFDADYEPTMVQSDFEERRVQVDLEDENPTITRGPAVPRGAVKRKSEPAPAPPSRGPLRKPAPGAPAHPALSARTQQPAVSALRKPRVSRRTPAGGVPAVPAPPGGSLISSLVDSALDKAPTKPVRGRSDAVPSPVRPQQSQVPVNPSNVRTQLEMEPARVPQAAQHSTVIPQNAESPTAQHPPAPPPNAYQANPAAYQLPPHLRQALPQPAAMISPAPGFPLAAPVATPNPFKVPGAPPPSFTKQLVALEADAIPDAYKLGRGRNPWVLRGILGAVCVVLGAVVGVVVLGGGGDKQKVESSILIESQPSGAVAVVNGVKQDKVTPVVFKGAEPGERYKIEVSLPRHKVWTKDIVIDEDGGQVKTLALLESIKGTLRVTSTPQGAEVVINGSSRGRTPVEIGDLDRDEVKVVELRLRGYKLARPAVDWGDEMTVKLHIKLEK